MSNCEGKKVAITLEVVEERRVICRACEQAVACAGNPARKCTCAKDGLPLKEKTASSAGECLMGKWEKIPIDAVRPAAPKRTTYELYPNGLGTMVRKGIDLSTLGMGKTLAVVIAHAMGKRGCGCGKRERCLNRLVPDATKLGILEWMGVGSKILVCIGAKEDQ